MIDRPRGIDFAAYPFLMSISNMNSLGQALPAAGGRAGSPSRRSFNVGSLNRPRSLQLAPIYPPNTGPSASNFERDLSLDIPAEIEQFALRMDWIGQVKSGNYE